MQYCVTIQVQYSYVSCVVNEFIRFHSGWMIHSLWCPLIWKR